MLMQYKSTEHPKDSHPSHIPNHLRVTLFRSLIALSDRDTSLVDLPPPKVLFPLAEFTNKLSLLLVPVSAVTLFELQSSVPERKNTKQYLYKTSGFPICKSIVIYRYHPQTCSQFCFPSLFFYRHFTAHFLGLPLLTSV